MLAVLEQQKKLISKYSQLMADAGLVLTQYAFPQHRIAAREKLEIIKRLDYERHDIQLVCQSAMDLYRCEGCAKEPETIQWIEDFVRPGDVFYDIGSNVGIYSFVVSKFTNGMARIYAFEPSFSTFSQLSKNIRLNACQDKITPLPIALSNQTGIQYLYYSNIESGAALHQLRTSPNGLNSLEAQTYAQSVLTYRLDDLIRCFSLRLPNHIKLDVDGNELDVLLGAEQALKDPEVRSILMEVDERSEDSRKAIQFLELKGFCVHAKRQHFGSAIWNYILARKGEQATR